MRLNRRGLLTAGGAVAVAGVVGTLVEYDRLPGRSDAHALLGLNGDPGGVPDVEPGESLPAGRCRERSTPRSSTTTA